MSYNTLLSNQVLKSRLIVKNLPKHLSEERLREHFASQGEVTDAKLMKTSDGTSRRFAFIGFRTEKDASRARKYFNDTYIDTSKIIVEKSKPIGDKSLPRPWSAHSAGSTANLQKTVQNQKKQEPVKPAEKDTKKDAHREELEKKKQHFAKLYEDMENPKLKEYLDVMSSRTKGRTWANDDIDTSKEDAISNGKAKKKAAPKVATVAVANRKTGGTGQVLTKTHVTFDDSDDDLYESIPGEDATEEKEDEIKDEDKSAINNMSDMDYLRSRMTLQDNDDDDIEADEDEDIEKMDKDDKENESDNEGGDYVDEESDKEDNMKLDETEPTSEDAPSTGPSAPLELPIQPEMSSVDKISDTGRLFVRNLPYTCTEEDLKKAFAKFGPLSEVHMPITKDTKKPKGFAYILYLLPEHAIKAYEALDQQSFQGRLLHILPAKEKPQAKEESDNGPNGSKLSLVKKQKETQRKAQAGSDFNWNSLFMSGDAVAASIADRLGVSKADVLNPEADNQAVRLALAETQIITETKEFFAKHGIVLDAFSKKERSDTVILVKNIPYGTSEEELRSLFGKHGDLGRVLLPPAKTIAIVEFLEPSEARTAFAALAYRRFKDTLIYLEKAPQGVFNTKYDPESAAKAAAAEPQEGKKVVSGSDLVGVDNETVDLDSVEGSTLFVKNLNFATTAEALQKAFSSIQGYRSSRINVKDDPKHPGKKLSMGFGFVEYDTKQNADKAMKAMQGYNLDGHSLQIKFSHRKSNTNETAKPGTGKSVAPGTKLIVRNVPFEATKKDLRELFGSFGQLKSLRIPKKFNGGHRGFAFLELMTKQDAKNVYDNMSSIHLYGRHLVLEWAAEEEGVEALREKTGKKFSREEQGPGGRGGKRQRVDLDHANDGFAASEMQIDDMSD